MNSPVPGVETVSCYVRTPSGFEWEVGWNPILIDELAHPEKTVPALGGAARRER